MIVTNTGACTDRDEFETWAATTVKEYKVRSEASKAHNVVMMPDTALTAKQPCAPNSEYVMGY